jgi:hypothetical protein
LRGEARTDGGRDGKIEETTGGSWPREKRGGNRVKKPRSSGRDFTKPLEPDSEQATVETLDDRLFEI